MVMIFNSLSRQKEPLKPIKPGVVSLYVCGMTVYDYCHIGHARVMVVFDMVTRYLRSCGYQVNYIRNITDIDDKIIRRAHEQGISIDALTAQFITALDEDQLALGMIPPNQEPRATEFMPAMIAMIETLIAKGYAYIATNGDVCYEVSHFPHYGQLAHKDLAGLRSGARVEINDSKRDPLDFVLWKLAKPGEPSWSSPWGEGRPGWHIECSAMSTHCLGNHFDIHGGGSDLQFPHHENEIAQSEAATGEHFVNTWMHVGFVQVNREKMSKSLGNFFTIREVLATYSAEIIRLFMIASHYRSPVNYSQESLEHAKGSLARLYTCMRGLTLPAISDQKPADNDYIVRFKAAMDDDFNTPGALTVLFELAHEISRLREGDIAKAVELAISLRYLGGILGLLQQDPDEYLQAGVSEDSQEIERLIAARNSARTNKAWAEADRIRAELEGKGIVLEDTNKGTIWRRE